MPQCPPSRTRDGLLLSTLTTRRISNRFPSISPPNPVTRFYLFPFFQPKQSLIIQNPTPFLVSTKPPWSGSTLSPPPPKRLATNSGHIANWARNKTAVLRHPVHRMRLVTTPLLPNDASRTVSMYDEGWFMTVSVVWKELYELREVQVLVHFDENVRGMASS